MRIYLPATLAELTGADLPSRLAHAVTPALRAALPEEDTEGLEYVALLLAAGDSLDLLDGVGPAGLRRVVVAGDVPDAAATPAGEPDVPSRVLLTTALRWDAIASAHIDEAAAEPDVAAARAGDADATERLEQRDLLWYDASELVHLVANLA